MKFKLPIEAFECCPACELSYGIKAVGVDVHCTNCGWHSAAAFVESGAYDCLINQYEQYLELQEKRRAQKRKERAAAKAVRKLKVAAKSKCAA